MPIIHGLRIFVYDIYPINSSPKNIDDQKQEGSLMVILTEEKKLNGGTHIPRKSNIVHLPNLMNITINL